LWAKHAVKDGTASIFMARPSMKIFKVLLSNLQTRNGTGMEKYLRKWTKNNKKNGGSSRYLGEKFNRVFSLQNGGFLGFVINCSWLRYQTNRNHLIIIIYCKNLGGKMIFP